MPFEVTATNQPMPSPPSGIDMRSPPQRPDACAFAMNVNFSVWPPQARYGVKPVSHDGTANRAYSLVRTLKDLNGHEYICTIESVGIPYLRVFGMSGREIADIDLTPYGYDVMHLGNVRRKWTGTTFFRGQHRVLLFRGTGGPILEWDPQQNESTVERFAMMDGDSTVVQYFLTPPSAGIMIQHAKCLWLAGEGIERNLLLTSPWSGGTKQGDDHYIPSDMLLGSDVGVRFHRNCVLYSEANRPNAIAGDQFYSIEDDYPLSGLGSLKGALIVFTSRSIWRLEGASPLVYTPRKVVDGVGCMSQETIAEGDGLLYFLGADGIYATDGYSAQKVSGALDPLWSGTVTSPTVPQTHNDWQHRTVPRMSQDGIDRSCGTVFLPERQYWCAVPTVHGKQTASILPRINDTIVVYDWEKKSCMLYDMGTDAATYRKGVVSFGKGLSSDVLYIGADVGLYAYRRGNLSLDVWSDDLLGVRLADGIPVLFLSQRYMRSGRKKRVEMVRAWLRSTGKMPAVAMGKSRIKWFVINDEHKHVPYIDGGADYDYGVMSGDLEPHPRGSLNYFWGEFTWRALPTDADAMVYHDDDVFCFEMPVGMESQWVQVGFSEYNLASTGSMLQLVALEFDREFLAP